MADNAFRPRKISSEDIGSQAPAEMDMAKMAAMQKAAGVEMPNEGDEHSLTPDGMGQPKLMGNLTPEMMKAMSLGGDDENKPTRGPMVRPQQMTPRGGFDNNNVLKKFIDGTKPFTQQYEAITLPSLGKFYNGEDGPTDGVVHVRPMTGAEEKILATPRFIKKGQAVNMIFKNCLMEKFDPENLLTIDRTYLLIYLRGISYSPDYEVQIRCTECQSNFNTTINLDTLYLDTCPDDFGSEQLTDVLPATGYEFTYRLSSGRDETKITEHRERRVKMWSDNAHDDTLLYRASLLIEQIVSSDGDVLTGQHNILSFIETLPIKDVAYIRNLLSNPPFGVDTRINLVCPSCTQDFNADLPLEANFFFPVTRRKRAVQA